MRSGGSVTMRSSLKRVGIEPDSCFWIRGLRHLPVNKKTPRVWRFQQDPPPDLVIEVDVSSSSLDRFAIYAALRVPEIWRLDDDRLTFHKRRGKLYLIVEQSSAFTGVAPTDILPF